MARSATRKQWELGELLVMGSPQVGAQISVPPIQTPIASVVGMADDAGNVSGDATLLPPFYRLLLALFQRTGGGSGIPTYNWALLHDAGSTQLDGTPLIPILNFVEASGKAVVLPSQMNSGQFVIVVCIGTTVSIFPPPGCQIDARGVNNAYIINATGQPKTQIFWFNTPTQAYSTQLG